MFLNHKTSSQLLARLASFSFHDLPELVGAVLRCKPGILQCHTAYLSALLGVCGYRGRKLRSGATGVLPWPQVLHRSVS